MSRNKEEATKEASATPEPFVQATFELPEEELRAVEGLATRRSTTTNQVLRQAILSELTIQELADTQERFLLQEEGKPLQEVVFPQAQPEK
jgi:predicted transcriptional regulator